MLWPRRVPSRGDSMKIIHALVPVGLLAAAAGPALAQPTLPPVDSPNTLPGDPEEPPPVVTEQPPVVTATSTETTPTTATTAAEPAAEPADPRPTEFAIALGLGYVIPS